MLKDVFLGFNFVDLSCDFEVDFYDDEIFFYICCLTVFDFGGTGVVVAFCRCISLPALSVGRGGGERAGGALSVSSGAPHSCGGVRTRWEGKGQPRV